MSEPPAGYGVDRQYLGPRYRLDTLKPRPPTTLVTATILNINDAGKCSYLLGYQLPVSLPTTGIETSCFPSPGVASSLTFCWFHDSLNVARRAGIISINMV